MQTKKIFKTVFSTTVLLASMASASQAQLGCPFSKKSAGNTVFQNSLNINSFKISNNPSLLQRKGFWLGAGAIGLLGAGSVSLLLKQRATGKINLSEENHPSDLDLITDELNLPTDLPANNSSVSHPEAPGGNLDVTKTDSSYEEKVIALTK